MKSRTLSVCTLVVLALTVALGPIPTSSYATPPQYTVSLKLADPEGTFLPAPDYQPHELGPEYTANQPTRNPGDNYAQDEVILRFRPDVPEAQRDALMAANGMRFGRSIYGEKAFVAKVAFGTAAATANSLRRNPLLEIASVNHVVTGFHDDANDPLATQQEHLTTINARAGWRIGMGLHQVSQIAIIDSGIDLSGQTSGGEDALSHPDLSAKYGGAQAQNWRTFLNPSVRNGNPLLDFAYSGHETHIAGLAASSTNNNQYVAGVGFTAWPISLQTLTDNAACGTQGYISDSVSAVNWASDHGASVINISWGCSHFNCPGGYGTDIDLLKQAIDRAYARGITVVAAAGNAGNEFPNYPAAFGEDGPWPTNERLVIAVAGSSNSLRDASSSYGSWIDVVAPYRQDDGQGILSTVPTEPYANCRTTYTHRKFGTSFSAPMVSGQASLLTAQGYSSSDVWRFITERATDLPCRDGRPCPGNDIETGYGLVNVGASMQLAERPTTAPGMTVVPNAGTAGIQWFNFQGSGLTPDGNIRICWTPPGQTTSCYYDKANHHGAAGLGLQPSSSNPTGIWSVYIYDETTFRTTATQTFTIVAPSD